MKKRGEWSDWYPIKEKQRNGKERLEIRRYRRVEGRTKWERLPHSEYRHLKPEDLQPFLDRLNGEREATRKRAEEVYRINHMFITKEILEEWERHIQDVTTTEELANAVLRKSRIFLHFFINILKLNDPIDWKENQSRYGKALLNKPEVESERIFPDKEPRSKRVIDDNVASANRFMSWLHTKNPRLFPLIKFDPISKAVLKKYEAKRKMDRPNRPGIGKHVNDRDWKKIEMELSPKILPFIRLAYYLGLRRAEALGVQVTDVRQGYFHLQRQLVSSPETGPVYGPPKNRKDRKVEYWFTTPDDIYLLIEELPDRMHPDTLTDRLAEEMKRLGLDYEMHDFRRTWITRALRTQPPTAVRLGAGHESLETTMAYVMDDREMIDAPYIPKKRAG